jgi:YaaC-like Protein
MHCAAALNTYFTTKNKMFDSIGKDTWQQLLGLESIDVVCSWHKKIFQRQLNTKRAGEITASAKQAREFFKNASNSANTVRPLLTFYGVASLARATILLLKPDGGENTLVRGHGLEPVHWSKTLSGEIPAALQSVGNLEIRTTAGLFHDFLTQTQNLNCMHISSAAVDWQLQYPVPPIGQVFRLNTLMAMMPDLQEVLSNTAQTSSCAYVNDMSYSETSGFLSTVNTKQFEAFQESYIDLGYEITQEGELSRIKCDVHNFQSCCPQSVHAYVNNPFGIPALYISKPLPDNVRLSQLAITYMLSYYLGMLTRYFPTQWVALHSGAKGDIIWPAIHATQQYVEKAFPELAIELILHKVAGSKT